MSMLNLDKTNTVKDKNEILNQIKNLTYKDTKILVKFIGDQGKILPRRITGLSPKQQKKISKLIKRARIMNLIPFVIEKY